MEKFVYRIRANTLQIGDIILTNGDNELKKEGEKKLKGKKISKSIRGFLKSKYSHVIIYLGGTCAHADAGGVNYFNLSKYYLYSTEKIEVLRYKEKLTLTDQLNLKRFIASRQGNEYCVKQALLSGINRNRSKDKNKQFCSKLIATAYENIEKRISNEILSSNITPKDLKKSKVLKKIELEFDQINIKEALKKLNPKSLEEQKKSVKKMGEHLKKICTDFKENYTSVNEILYFQKPDLRRNKNFKKIDSLIVKAIKSTGYDEFWKYDYTDNPELYNLDEKKRYLDNLDRNSRYEVIYRMTNQIIEELNKEKERLYYLYNNMRCEINFTLICLFTKILEKHYKLIETNYEYLNISSDKIKLKHYLSYQMTTEKLMMSTYIQNYQKLQRMINQGEKLIWKLENTIY